MPRLVLASVLFAALATDVFQGPRRVSGGAPAVLPPHAAGGGEVFLEVNVSASGAVAEIKTVRDGPPFTDALRDALKGWRFEPAKQAGAAVASAVLVAGVFRPPVLVGGAPAGSPPVSGRPDCDEIPVPAEAVTPPYPTQGQGDHVVLAEVMVERDGGVARASVVEGTGVFARTASDAARRWRFRPACHKGEAFATRAYLVFGFKAPAIAPPVKR